MVGGGVHMGFNLLVNLKKIDKFLKPVFTKSV